MKRVVSLFIQKVANGTGKDSTTLRKHQRKHWSGAGLTGQQSWKDGSSSISYLHYGMRGARAGGTALGNEEDRVMQPGFEEQIKIPHSTLVGGLIYDAAQWSHILELDHILAPHTPDASAFIPCTSPRGPHTFQQAPMMSMSCLLGIMDL